MNKDKELLLSIFEKYEGAVPAMWVWNETIGKIKNTIPVIGTHFHQVDLMKMGAYRSIQADKRYREAIDSLLAEGIIEECNVVARWRLMGDYSQPVKSRKEFYVKLPTGVTECSGLKGYALIKD